MIDYTTIEENRNRLTDADPFPWQLSSFHPFYKDLSLLRATSIILRYGAHLNLDTSLEFAQNIGLNKLRIRVKLVKVNLWGLHVCWLAPLTVKKINDHRHLSFVSLERWLELEGTFMHITRLYWANNFSIYFVYFK